MPLHFEVGLLLLDYRALPNPGCGNVGEVARCSGGKVLNRTSQFIIEQQLFGHYRMRHYNTYASPMS